MNRFTKVILVGSLALGLQGCKDVARDLFGIEEAPDSENLVALDVRVTDNDTVQEQSDWSIRADIDLSFGDEEPDYELEWQIIDAPAGFDMPLTVVPANDDGQTFLQFTTPDVDEDTTITLEMTVRYNNGDSDEVITEQVDVLIEANEQVVISGAVVDQPIPFALVKVVVGDLVFETEADGDGNYTIELEFKDNDLIAQVTAVGTGAFSSVEFKSYLGDGTLLQRAAGADGIISSDENDNVNVTNITTAEFVLIEDALENGEQITTQEQLDDVVAQIDVNQVLQIAAVIKAVVDDGKALPEGTTTVLELVKNKAVKDKFVEDLLNEDPDYIDNLVQTIVDDPVLVPEDTSFDVAQKFFAVKAGDFQNLTSEVINLSDDVENGKTVGTWSTYYGSFDVTWEKVNKAYHVQFEDNAFTYTDCTENAGVETCRNRYLKSAVINKLPDAGDTTSILVDYKYKNVNTANNADVTESKGSNTFSIYTEKEIIPFTQEELTSQEWVLRVLDESLDNSSFAEASFPFESVYTTFNEDGTGSYHQVLGNEVVNFTWEIKGLNFPGLNFNLLQIDVAAEDNVNSSDHSMVFAQVFNRRGVRQTTLVIDAPDFNKVNPNMLNRVVSLNATMTPVNDELNLESQSLIGRYALRARVSEAPNFFLQFNGDGSGFQESIDGTASYLSNFEWQKTDRGLVAKYYSRVVTDEQSGQVRHEPIENCEGYSASECYLSRQRHFDVLDIKDNLYITRIYQVQYALGDMGDMGDMGETYGTFYSSYIGIFERRNQTLTNVTGEKILLWEDGQAAQKGAVKLTLNADGTGSVHADNVSDLTWQQVNPYQIDVTFTNLQYTYNYQSYCQAIDDDVTVSVVETTDSVSILAAESKMKPDNRAGRWYVTSFGNTVGSVEDSNCQEFAWDEEHSDTEVVNVLDASSLSPLMLTAGRYAFEHPVIESEDGRGNVFSVALQLESNGNATNLLDDRTFTWSGTDSVTLTNGDQEYHFTHYFERVGEAYYALGNSVDEFGNNEFDAFLVVPFDGVITLDSDLVGSYAEVSNGYEPEVRWWLEFFDDNTGGMGDMYGNSAWAWSLQLDATTTLGKTTDVQAIKANRYRYVFFDENSDGVADDVNQDGTIDMADVDYEFDLRMTEEGLSKQKMCHNGVLVCHINNARNYYLINQSGDYSFWFRDATWNILGDDEYLSHSFGLFTVTADPMSPLAKTPIEAKTGSRFDSHSARSVM